MLMKRLTEDEQAYLKRTFTAEERKDDAKSGAAMKDGSFPIENKGDLHNAMKLAGHAKDPAAARAHIKSRAAALGLTSELSDAYKGGDKGRIGKFFDSLFGKKDEAERVDDAIDKSVAALAESVASILKDQEGEAASSSLTETFGQFGDFLKKEVGVALATGDVVLAEIGKTDKGENMSALLKKALGLPDAATEEQIVEALAKKDKAASDLAMQVELLKANMDKDETKFHDGLKTDELKKSFRAMDKVARQVEMTKGTELPDYVKKMMSDNAALAEQVAKLSADRGLEDFKKKAVEIGMVEADAGLLQKAYAGDKASIDTLAERIKALTVQAKAGGLFKEFGDNRNGNPDNNDPDAQLRAKADELRKSAAGKDLTFEQAYAKVYADPANKELAGAERNKNRPQAA